MFNSKMWKISFNISKMDSKNISCLSLRETFMDQLIEKLRVDTRYIQSYIKGYGDMKEHEKVQLIYKLIEILRIHHAIIEPLCESLMDTNHEHVRGNVSRLFHLLYPIHETYRYTD